MTYMQSVLWRWVRRVPRAVWFLGLVLAAYALTVVREWHWYVYQINPDGISYLDIARLYLRGDWSHALNAYWGPMLSWLIVPGLAAGWAPLVAAKAATVAAGAVALVAFYLLARRFVSPLVSMALTVFAGAVVVSWALASYITPDLVLAVCILWYLYFVTSPAFGRRWPVALLAGVMAGLAYLTKSYAFPFFILHFTAYVAWRWWRRPGERRRWEQHFLIGLAGFFLVALPWIVAISRQEHRLTYGTSGAYTLALAAPGSTGHPVMRNGLFVPPAGGTSAWMRPVAPVGPSWLPTLWPRPHNFSYAKDKVIINSQELLKLLGVFWPLSTGIVAAVLLLAYRRRSPLPERARFGIKFLTFTAILYTLGYLLIFVEDRYIWPVQLMVLVLGGILFDWLWADRLIPRVALALLAVFGLFTIQQQPAEALRVQRNANIEVPRMAQQIKATPDYHCRAIASNASWELSSYIAFDLGCPYFGMFGPYDPGDNAAQLRRYHVDYLMMWKSGDKKRDAVPADYHEVANLRSQALKVYRFEPAPAP
jgi:4-amino-4-deoxy-L-arabinose transferase-like glycosyltransferase